MHGMGRTVGLAMLAMLAVGGCSVGSDDGPAITPTGSGTTRTSMKRPSPWGRA